MTPSTRAAFALLLSTAALGVPVQRAAAQRAQDPATVAIVRRLLELTGAARQTLTGMEALVPAQRAAMPQVPAVFWDAFLARARHDLPQLIDSIIPVYTAHFSKAELAELVRFYESPIGRRLSDVQPLLMQESMQVGQRWGSAIGQAVGDSLAQAGKPKQE